MAVSAAPVRLRLNLERVQESLFFSFFMLRNVNEKEKTPDSVLSLSPVLCSVLSRFGVCLFP